MSQIAAMTSPKMPQMRPALAMPAEEIDALPAWMSRVAWLAKTKARMPQISGRTP